MSKRGKILLVIGILLLSPVLALLIAPQFWKGKLIQAVKKEINRSTAAEVNFSDEVSVSIWRSFPDLNLEIHQLSVLSPGFSTDTLLYVDRAYLKLDVMSVWKGERISVKALTLSDALLHLEFDSANRGNYEVLLTPGDTSESSPLSLDLKHIALKNSHIRYLDFASDMAVLMDSVDVLASADFTSDTFNLNSQLAVRSLTYSYENIDYIHRAALTGNADLSIDLNRMEFRFLNNNFVMNEIPVKFDGMLGLPENGDVVMDLALGCPGVTLKQALSMVPLSYQSYLNGLQASGDAQIKGKLKGVYNDSLFPSYALEAGLSKGRLQYEGMPLPVEKIQLRLLLENPDGKDESARLSLEPLKFALQNESFELSLKAFNLFGDPLLNGKLNGKLHLDRFAQFFPLDKGTRLAGLLQADMKFNGKVSAFESGRLDQNNNASGSLKISELFYRGPEIDADVKAPRFDLVFTPDYRALMETDLRIGQSDMQIAGELKNLLAVITSTQTLDGSLRMKSNKLNLDELLSLLPASESSTTSAQGSSAMAAPEIPKGIHVDLISQIGELVYNKTSFKSVKADARIFDGTLLIREAALESFGGRLSLNGAYQPAKGKGMFTDLNLDLSMLNIPAFLGSFDLTRKLAPFYERMEGMFNAKLHLSSVLKNDLSPDLASLNIQGLFNGSSIKLHQIPGLKSLGEKLQIRELQDVETKAMQVAVELLSGRLNVKPFHIEHKGIRLEMGGFTALDQKINYQGKLFVPASLVQGDEKVWNDLVAKTPFKAATVSPDDVLEINVGILGTALKPDVKFSLKDVKKGLKAAVQDRIKSELDQQKKEAEARVQAEIDAARKQAEEKAREMEAKARQELENQRKAAEQRAREEAERKRKELEEAARKKLKDVLKPPL